MMPRVLGRLFRERGQRRRGDVRLLILADDLLSLRYHPRALGLALGKGLLPAGELRCQFLQASPLSLEIRPLCQDVLVEVHGRGFNLALHLLKLPAFARFFHF